jgi:hypothetical protein
MRLLQHHPQIRLQPVQAPLAVVDAVVGHGSRERHERLRVGVAALANVLVDRLLVADRVEPRGGHHHRLPQPADLLASVGAEVLDDDLGLLRQVVRVK